MNISIGAPKVLGVELDNGISRVVEMEFKSKTPKLYHAMTIPSPSDLISEDGLVSESELFRQSFKEQLRQLNINADRIAFSVSSSRIINREIVIPMVRESKIETLIYQNATDYFPITITDYKLIYNILGKTEQNGKKQYRLLVCAVPRDIIRSYYRFADYLGMSIAAIDFAGNGIFQTLKAVAKETIRDTVGSDKTELYLAVYSHSSLLTFVREGTICLQRMISVGIGDTLDELMENAQTSATSVETMLRDTDLRLFSGGFSRSDAAVESPLARRTDALKPLVNSIRRSVEYFLSGNDNTRIEVYLVGGIKLYNGFAELLSAELDLPVCSLETPLEKRYPEIGCGFSFTASEFLAPIGACTQPVNLADRQRAKTVSAADIFNDHAVQNTLLAIGSVCFAICIAASCALYFMTDAQKRSLQSQEKKLREDLIALGDTGSALKDYTAAKNTFDSLDGSIKQIAPLLETNNDHFVSFMEEMERKMPKTFRAIGINVNESGVVLNVRVDTEDEAAFVIQTLRNCTSVELQSVSDITMRENGQGVEYDISSLLDDNGHLSRANLSKKYADLSQAELDELIPALKNGSLNPAELYSNFVAVKKTVYTIDDSIMFMVNSVLQGSNNPMAQYVEPMMNAVLEYLNRTQPQSYSMLEDYNFVNREIFPLADYGITEEMFKSVLSKLNLVGGWDGVFNKKTETTYQQTDGGTGIVLPEINTSAMELNFTVSLKYTGQFEDMESDEEPSEAQE